MQRSRVTVPERAHPLVRAVFAEMQEQGLTYVELSQRSGICRETTVAWRLRNKPDLASLEAVLGALGKKLAIVPDEAAYRGPARILADHARQQQASA